MTSHNQTQEEADDAPPFGCYPGPELHFILISFSPWTITPAHTHTRTHTHTATHKNRTHHAFEPEMPCSKAHGHLSKHSSAKLIVPLTTGYTQNCGGRARDHHERVHVVKMRAQLALLGDYIRFGSIRSMRPTAHKILRTHDLLHERTIRRGTETDGRHNVDLHKVRINRAHEVDNSRLFYDRSTSIISRCFSQL